MLLGIDFGTTRTAAAMVEKGNYPVCTFSWKGDLKEYIPSMVAAKGHSLFFGWEAAELIHDPDVHLLRSMKRLAQELRPEDPVEISPEISLPLLELMTQFFLHLKEMLTGHSNLLRKKAKDMEVMVATANASSNQRYMTLEAFRRAGFRVLGAMNEPSAAAVEFAHRYLGNLGPKSPKKYMVVYDLGGGTFDTSAVGLADRNYEAIGHEGIARLGGDDFDRVILDLTLDALGESMRTLTQTEDVRLLEECRERKEGLKANTRKMVVDPGPAMGEERPVMIDTGEVYARCEPLIQQTIDKLETVLQGLRALGIDPEDNRSLAAIYLVGGSVSFPPVARRLRELYTGKVKTSPFPHAATAIGLAVAGDPDARVRVRETISRHFGVWREQELGREKFFDPIFFKHREVDPESGRLEVTRAYRPTHNIGHLRYLECTSLGSRGEPEGDISLWKDAFFPYDPSLQDRQDLSVIPVETRHDLQDQEVVETYGYDQAGQVRVQIENRTAGYRKVFNLGPGTIS